MNTENTWQNMFKQAPPLTMPDEFLKNQIKLLQDYEKASREEGESQTYVERVAAISNIDENVLALAKIQQQAYNNAMNISADLAQYSAQLLSSTLSASTDDAAK